jgi:hypothetical protein
VILIGLLLVLAGLSVTVLSALRSLRHSRGELLTAGAEGRRLIILAALAALLAAVALAVIPVYASSTGERSTLVDVNGAAVLLVLLLPVLLAASPLLARGPGQVLLAASCGTLLAVFCVLGGFTVGSYYLPAATLLLAAAAVGLRARRTA